MKHLIQLLSFRFNAVEECDSRRLRKELLYTPNRWLRRQQQFHFNHY